MGGKQSKPDVPGPEKPGGFSVSVRQRIFAQTLLVLFMFLCVLRSCLMAQGNTTDKSTRMSRVIRPRGKNHRCVTTCCCFLFPMLPYTRRPSVRDSEEEVQRCIGKSTF